MESALVAEAKDDENCTPMDRVGDILLEGVRQYAHFAGAAFVFYEDRFLFACSAAGLIGMLLACAALEAVHISPTLGDRLWRWVVPTCGVLAVFTAICSRLAHITAYRSVCAVLLLMSFGITMFSVRGDKDAKLQL
mmetsp:Transcript_53811/g.156383  ORF Transcript_53811/g.156383 Transcript_53811/m.156383 type:complete len:136 (+) Transcript_53811:73-480(+)